MRAQVLAALSLTLTVAIAALAGRDEPKAVQEKGTVVIQDDLKQLQGNWTIAVMEEGGQKAPDDLLKDMSVLVKDDKLSVQEKDKVILEFKLKLDSSKTPKAIDFSHILGADKGQTELGIYVFDGDTVKFCINEKGKERPKEFSTAPTNKQNLVVLKRKK